MHANKHAELLNKAICAYANVSLTLPLFYCFSQSPLLQAYNLELGYATIFYQEYILIKIEMTFIRDFKNRDFYYYVLLILLFV